MSEDTYRIRLVLEKCVHNDLGNWCDTQEVSSKIFFGVNSDVAKTEKDFVQGCNILNNHDKLMAAIEKIKIFAEGDDNGENIAAILNIIEVEAEVE